MWIVKWRSPDGNIHKEEICDDEQLLLALYCLSISETNVLVSVESN
jgi:hypothetical protein